MRFLTTAAVLAGLGVAATGASGATLSSKPLGSCPSQQSVMTSNWYGATTAANGQGYLCAEEYHSGDMNLGAWQSNTFSQNVNVSYFPQYYCWNRTNSAVSYAHAEIFGSGSVTATNWDTTNHHWGAGYLYTLGSGTVTGFSNSGCSATSSQVWDSPPAVMRPTSISASGVPDSSAQAGSVNSITVTVAPGSYAAGSPAVLQDGTANVASGTISSNGTATFNWVPAQMGSRTIKVAWPGNSQALGNMTDTHTVNVSGGLAMSVSPNVNWNYDNDTAQATVTLDASPGYLPTSTQQVVLRDLATSTNLASFNVTPAANTPTMNVNLGFAFNEGQTYKLIAFINTSSSTFTPRSYETDVNAGFPVYIPPPCKKGPCPMSRENAVTSSGAEQAPQAGARRLSTARHQMMRGRATPPAGMRGVPSGTESVSASSRITGTSRSLSLTCPTGHYPLNVSATSSGPAEGFRIAYGDSGATVTSPPQNVGYRMNAQAICRVEKAAVSITGPMVLGTRVADVLVSRVANATAFGGSGNDRMALRGTRSVAWGGLGNDRIAVRGTDSVAVGGTGRDRLVALGSGRSLLIGGPGRDVMVGGSGATHINAMDGRPGDRVVCRSSKNRVMADAGDTIVGPCQMVTAS